MLSITTKIASVAFLALAFFAGETQTAQAQNGRTRVILSKKSDLYRGLPKMKNGAYYRVYKMYGRAGNIYTFALASRQFDTYIWVQNHNRFITVRDAICRNDDFGSGTNSATEMRCTRSGYFYIVVTSYRGGETGQFNLLVGETPTR